MKTLICVNVLDNVKSEIYGSHCQEWFRLGRSTNDEFILFHPARLSIDTARNQAAAFALQTECDFLYFIDDDMILSPNTYKSLKECIDRGADIAMALTFIRSAPFDCMAFKWKDSGNLEYFNDYESSTDKVSGTFDAAAVGFACCLIKTECLNLINPPYFVTGVQSTEDVYFCLKLHNKAKKPIKIVVDTKVPTGHLLHSEAIGVNNIAKFRSFYSNNKNKGETDRGQEYLESCKKAFQKS